MSSISFINKKNLLFLFNEIAKAQNDKKCPKEFKKHEIAFKEFIESTIDDYHDKVLASLGMIENQPEKNTKISHENLNHPYSQIVVNALHEARDTLDENNHSLLYVISDKILEHLHDLPESQRNDQAIQILTELEAFQHHLGQNILESFFPNLGDNYSKIPREEFKKFLLKHDIKSHEQNIQNVEDILNFKRDHVAGHVNNIIDDHSHLLNYELSVQKNDLDKKEIDSILDLSINTLNQKISSFFAIWNLENSNDKVSHQGLQQTKDRLVKEFQSVFFNIVNNGYLDLLKEKLETPSDTQSSMKLLFDILKDLEVNKENNQLNLANFFKNFQYNDNKSLAPEKDFRSLLSIPFKKIALDSYLERKSVDDEELIPLIQSETLSNEDLEELIVNLELTDEQYTQISTAHEKLQSRETGIKNSIDDFKDKLNEDEQNRNFLLQESQKMIVDENEYQTLQSDGFFGKKVEQGLNVRSFLHDSKDALGGAASLITQQIIPIVNHNPALAKEFELIATCCNDMKIKISEAGKNIQEKTHLNETEKALKSYIKALDNIVLMIEKYQKMPDLFTSDESELFLSLLHEKLNIQTKTELMNAIIPPDKRIETGEAKQVHNLSKKIIDNIKLQYPDHIIDIKMSEKIEHAFVLERPFCCALRNYVKNACKFSEVGKKVTIRMTKGQAGPGRIRVSVEDQGVGISDKKIGELFYNDTPGETGVDGTESEGNGLYGVRENLELANGSFDYKNYYDTKTKKIGGAIFNFEMNTMH